MPNTSPHLIAGGTIRTSRFVKISTAEDNTGLEADANEAPIGVSYEGSNYAPLSDLVTTDNAATDGQQFRLYGPGDICLVTAGEAITRGAMLKSDADGKAVTAASTGTTVQWVGGWALESASGDGVRFRMFVSPFPYRPALT